MSKEAMRSAIQVSPEVPPGEVLVHCGDFCDAGSLDELDDFCAWLDALPHAHKVCCAGNHDWLLDEEVAGLAAGGFVDSPGLVAEGGQLPRLDLTPS